jgi:tripartite-type tricarboxylate transporter receptor subunit TctC
MNGRCRGVDEKVKKIKEDPKRRGGKPMDRKDKILSVLMVGVFVVMFLAGISPAQCQEKYPRKAVDVIVSFAPGGATDLTARVMCAFLKQKWGVPVNVVNKPGGNNVPACLEVYNAKPDGYTILADGTPQSSMLPIVERSLPFDVMKRTFIASAILVPFVFAVPADSPFKTLKDIEQAAKRDPENFTWTSLGGAALHDFCFRQFFKKIGVDILKTKAIMSQGGSQAVVLTAGKHVMVGGGTTSSCLPSLKGGLIRGIAISAPTRWPDLPDIPTTKEQGYPEINASDFKGVSGPPNLPSHIIDVWDKAVQEMVKDPETVANWRKVGAMPFYLNARDTIAYVKNEMEELKRLWDVK